MTETLIDTNILVYLADKEDHRHLAAAKWFEGAVPDQLYAISLQNLREFSSVCLKKTELSSREISEWVSLFARFFRVIEDSKDDVMIALSISEEYSIHFWDALLISTMQRNGISKIITENAQDFEKHGKITVLDIFSQKQNN